MNRYIDKANKDKNRSIQENSTWQMRDVSTPHFEDNRPEAVAQRRLQALADQNNGTSPAAALREVAGATRRTKQVSQTNPGIVMRMPKQEKKKRVKKTGGITKPKKNQSAKKGNTAKPKSKPQKKQQSPSADGKKATRKRVIANDEPSKLKRVKKGTGETKVNKKVQKGTEAGPKAKTRKRAISVDDAKSTNKKRKTTAPRLLNNFTALKDDDNYAPQLMPGGEGRQKNSGTTNWFTFMNEPFDNSTDEEADATITDSDMENILKAEGDEAYHPLFDDSVSENETSRSSDDAEQSPSTHTTWNDRDVLVLGTANLDHYSETKTKGHPKHDKNEISSTALREEMSIAKNELRMREIVYFLSTNTPDILVIQEIQNYKQFKDDFAKQSFTVAQEPEKDVYNVTSIDKLQQKKEKKKHRVVSQYIVTEQPEWKAGKWGEKNAIIINTATVAQGSKMYRYDTSEKEASLKEITPGSTLKFGAIKNIDKSTDDAELGGKKYQPRDPVITEFIYAPYTDQERIVAIINVHTNPKAEGPGATMKNQNQYIMRAMEACKKTGRYHAVFAIGDFYMEKADPATFSKLVEGHLSKKKGALATPRTTHATNNPNPHTEGYQIHDRERVWKKSKKEKAKKDGRWVYEKKSLDKPVLANVNKKSHKGQKADMLIYYKDQLMIDENTPNTLPPMYPPSADKDEMNSFRQARFYSDETDNKFIGKTDNTEEFSSRYITQDDRIEEEKFVLSDKHVAGFRKPGPDHSFRIFKGYLNDQPVHPTDKRKSLARRRSLRMPQVVARFFTAIHQRDDKTVQDMVSTLTAEKRLPFLDSVDYNGRTPLMAAIDSENPIIVNILLEAKKKHIAEAAAEPLPDSWEEISSRKRVPRDKHTDQYLIDTEVTQGIEGANIDDINVTPVVDIANHTSLLATVIQDNYMNMMTNRQNPSTYTVVPINISNAHWATLVIVQNENRRSAPTVYFFDSLGSTKRTLSLISKMLKMTGVYTNVATISDLSDRLQEDGYTCGTWAIQSAIAIVRGLTKGTDLNGIKKNLTNLQKSIKSLHYEILTKRK